METQTQVMELTCPVSRSFRAAQTAGMFDLELPEKWERRWEVELPKRDAPWRIGVIVGPSGSGKTTVARTAWGRLFEPPTWPPEQAVIDGFDAWPLETVTRALTAVGLGSPPLWLRPQATLSNGERFRRDLAFGLLTVGRGLLVCDEFASVVDRRVARFASVAIAAALRKERFPARLVAVTCHEDVVPWLAPDWVLELPSGRLTRRRLRRPELRVEVGRCSHQAYAAFAQHHYLGGQVPSVAECYAAILDQDAAAFCAVVGLYGRRGRKRISRLVVKPEYQGLGLGLQLAERVCRDQTSRGFRICLTASHPAVVGHCRRSRHWRAAGVRRVGQTTRQFKQGRPIQTAVRRATASFEWIGGDV